jgi:hypothetical protein
MSFNRRVLNTKFAEWIEEETYISKGVQYAPRKYVIYQFIQELCQYVGSMGYVFRASEKEMAQAWARYLFRAQNNLLKGMVIQQNPEDTPEDYDWFCHIFDYDGMEPFINKWKYSDDYNKEYNWVNCLYDAFLFAWYYVDIKASSATKNVDDIFAESESEEEGKKGRLVRKTKDPYLDDQANMASKFNRWD